MQHADLLGCHMRSHEVCAEHWINPNPVRILRADGWIMALVERISKNISELVIIDTRDFTKAIAYVQLPFHVKGTHEKSTVSTTA